MSDENKMRPIIILPPDFMSQEDIAKLEGNLLCVVVAKEPDKVKFVDPIPSISSRTKIEDAAIQLSRRLLTGRGFNFGKAYNSNNGVLSQREIAEIFCDILTQASPLQRDDTKDERKQAIYNVAFDEETRKLAREDAKRERDAKKTKAKP